jgi:hypothetical protein
MGKLKRLSGEEIIKVLKRLGFEPVRVLFHALIVRLPYSLYISERASILQTQSQFGTMSSGSYPDITGMLMISRTFIAG